MRSVLICQEVLFQCFESKLQMIACLIHLHSAFKDTWSQGQQGVYTSIGDVRCAVRKADVGTEKIGGVFVMLM